MELSNYSVSWVVTYLRDLQPTYRDYNPIYYLATKHHEHPSIQEIPNESDDFSYQQHHQPSICY